MNLEEFETCWLPIPLRWRNVSPGDVIVGKGAKLWTVVEHLVHNVSARDGYPNGMLGIRLTSGDDEYKAPSVDPDETVQVLMPAPMVQAAALCREELGARLIASRTGRAA